MTKKCFFTQKPHRLSTLLMSLIAIWLIGAISIVGLSLNISWRLDEMGVAINNAGSLRKRVFHIMLLSSNNADPKFIKKEAINFHQVANNITNIPVQNFFDTNHHAILKQKIDTIQKALDLFLEKQTQEDELITTEQYLAIAQELADKISDAVLIIERDNTQSIERLRILQTLLILMAFISAIASSRLLKKFVITPLNQIYKGIQKIGYDHFETKVEVNVFNEFSKVADGFNSMTSRLKDFYDNLEEKVEEKTQALSQRNAELLFLYETTSLIQKSTEKSYLVTEFLQKILQYSHAKSGTIRLINKNKNQLELIANENIPKVIQEAKACNILNNCYCGKGVYEDHFVVHNSKINTNNSITPLLCQLHISNDFVTIPIHHNNEKLGVITLYFDDEPQLTEDQKFILETVIAQFALAVIKFRLIALDKQFAVLEERNNLAQGLHDSIAQSLAFIKMQLPQLEKSIRTDDEIMKEKTLSFIKEGIEECYADIRELLSNFRTRIAKGSFKNTIDTVIDRFEQQNVVVNRSIGEKLDLTPDEQLQVLFILQEALSNIRKHANATVVDINIEQNNDFFMMSVADNGIGFEINRIEEFENQGHLGTKIMRERIQKVNGTIEYDTNYPKGTIIKILLPK